MQKIIAILLLAFSGSAFATDEPRDVPRSLFGITLGAIYDIGDPESNDLGNIPIKKFAGMNRFLGHGIHYYFQPVKEYKAFEYIEKREKPEDQYFATSFRLYLLPVIPDSITTIDQLNNTKLNREVTTIEWSSHAKTRDDEYYWASNLCKTFAVDISLKPEIKDYYEEKWYECIFSSENREFKVSSSYSRSVELSYNRQIRDKKHEKIEKQVRRMEAEDIRPY